ncbi:RES family NAD+ phosphorylase [Massilia sp. W12]|uniref:RES family NAD+ phosphorylase n=1 Tax=Massilia sp. W12 TaxID=3126507 RepID=UPI0030CD268C
MSAGIWPQADAALIEAAGVQRAPRILPPGSALHHIHESCFDPASFNPGLGQGRFHPFTDAHGRSVPVYYAAQTEIGSYCETLLRALDSNLSACRVLSARRAARYSYALLHNRRELRLADLSGSMLLRLGLTRGALLEPGPPHYAHTQHWAQAIHAACPQLHGLSWISRQHDASLCLMLFGDRVHSADLQLQERHDLATLSGQQRLHAVAASLCVVVSH